jgi:arabinan endo-1,5-alpha-L-arabinosidase
MWGTKQAAGAWKRHLRRRPLAAAIAIALLAGLAHLGRQESPAAAAPTQAAAPVATALPQNPVLRRDVPDPGVLRVGRFYYLYATSDQEQRNGAMPIYRSADLRNWTLVGQIFPPGRLPSWSQRNGKIYKFWAPEVRRIGNRYVAYYATIDRRNCDSSADVERRVCRFSIGVATAARPSGPFRDRGRVATNPSFSLIDPSYFRDPRTGRQYLLWKDNTNAQGKPTHIVLHDLRADGLRLGPGRSHRLITNDLGWEGRVVEAPTLVYRRGAYYLFYSGNNYATDHYAVGFARSNTVDRGYRKPGDLRGPILKSDRRFDGAGGQSILRVGGQWLIFYHARLRQAHTAKRYLMLDRIWWDSIGLPHVNDGTPSG